MPIPAWTLAIGASLLLAIGGDAVALTWHVHANEGVDVQGGGGPENPVRSIQYALDRASEGDTILLAAGVYTGNVLCDIPKPGYVARANAVACLVNKSVEVRGGFRGGLRPDGLRDWTTRDWRIHQTILDGQHARRALVIYDPGSLRGTSSLFEGVIFANGKGLALPYRDGPPGKSEPDAVGGAILVEGSNLRLQDCDVRQSEVWGPGTSNGRNGAGAGGGLGLRDNIGDGSIRFMVTLNRVNFLENKAVGGLAYYDPNLPNNPWPRVSGGYGQGGGLFSYRYHVNATEVVFDGNTAYGGRSDAGARGWDQGIGDVADAQGGGASVHDGIAIFRGGSVRNNQAIGGNSESGTPGSGYGGGLYAEDGHLFQLEGVRNIEGNTAMGGTGATVENRVAQFPEYAAPVPGVGHGGGLYSHKVQTRIYDTWIVGNHAVGGTDTAKEFGDPDRRSGAGMDRMASAGGGGAAVVRLTHLLGSSKYAPPYQVVFQRTRIVGNVVQAGAVQNGKAQPTKPGGHCGGGGTGIWLANVGAEFFDCEIAGNTTPNPPSIIHREDLLLLRLPPATLPWFYAGQDPEAGQFAAPYRSDGSPGPTAKLPLMETFFFGGGSKLGSVLAFPPRADGTPALFSKDRPAAYR